MVSSFSPHLNVIILFKSLRTFGDAGTAIMVVVTPGIDFIALQLANSSAPPILLGCVLRAVSTVDYSHILIWVVLSGFSLFFPLVLAARVIYRSFNDRRQAAAVGARLAPTVDGKIIGNINVLGAVELCMRTGYPGDEFTDIVPMSEKGPIVNIRFMASDLIFTFCPEHIKIILATDFNNYMKGKRFYQITRPLFGSGIFNSDGDKWKFHRSMARPFFSRHRISDFDLFDRHAAATIALIKKRMRSGYAIDIQDLMSRYALDSASELLFGHCFHALKSAVPYPHNTSIPSVSISGEYIEFSRAFREVQEAISFRERCGWFWPLTEIWEDKIKGPMKVINAFIEPVIKEAVKRKKVPPDPKQTNGEFHVEDKQTLLDFLVSATSDPAVLKDEILTMIVASRDTTGGALTFILYFLAMHPAANMRLREEILAHVGPTRCPDYDDIKKMKYLRAVINETLRLFPLVPFNTRECINATIWPSPDPNQKPIYIPAGTKVPFSVFLMHRRKDLWGPDAEEFDPDRFLDHRFQTYLAKNPSIFLPFNTGPRLCLGQELAYNKISFMIIRLLQQFSSVSLDDEASPPDARPPPHWANGSGRKKIERVYPKVHINIFVKGGLWLRMTEAEAAEEEF